MPSAQLWCACAASSGAVLLCHARAPPHAASVSWTGSLECILKKKIIGCGFCRSIQKCIFRAYVEHSSADLNHSFFFLSYQAASTQTFTRSPINKVGRRGTHPKTDSHLKCAISFCRCKHEATIQKISVKSSNHWE